jgi:hypothetical protein
METGSDSGGRPVRSTAEAVTRAAADFSDTLVFLRQAFDSARRSPYDQPAKVYRALRALHEVCLELRAAGSAGRTGRALFALFRERGFHYKPHESNLTRGKWEEEYRAHYAGRRVSIEPHLALGKGGPKTCLRIHFYLDETGPAPLFVVAHCGRHKTNTRT